MNSVPWNPLRIKVISRLDSSTLSAGNKTFLTDKLLPDAVDYWKRTLSIRRPQKLLVEGNCTHVWSNNKRCATVSTENYCSHIRIDNTYVARHAYYVKSTDTNPSYKPATEPAGTTEGDYILYVTADATQHCGGQTLAYAATCRRDSNDRPVMGYANFCPEHVMMQQISTGSSLKPQNMK